MRSGSFAAGHGLMAGSCEHGKDNLDSIKSREFPHCLSDS
jgi:hypothetical protein